MNSDIATAEVAVTSTALGQQTSNGTARVQALQALQQQTVATTSVIEYHSQGHLVIIGPATEAVPLAEQLLQQLATIAIVDPDPSAQHPALDDRIPFLHAKVDRIEGHLGDFQVELHDRGKQTLALKSILGRTWPQIDMVLDLSVQPYFDAQISPPGYFATRGDANNLASYLVAIPELVGDFEKPRYFKYNPDICVHARNQMTACTRCIDACPTLAIRSIGEHVEVDPYLCQGGGSCAAVCPSGAMQYVYPALADTLSRIRQLLKTYREAQGHEARMVFIEESQHERFYQQLASLDENLIPVAVDELGALDMAVLLNTLAYGAQQVIVVAGPDTPSRIRDTLQQQQALATQFLQGQGYSPERVVITAAEDLPVVTVGIDEELPAASYATFDDKRTMIHLALEHLYQHAPLQPEILGLSDRAPFGAIRVDAQRCTLCMACTGACPTGSMLAGNESPQLKFIEENCVQCGLCEQTCPENAISREPRYLFNTERRRARRLLYEEAPFHCISCGKPFATRRVIENIQDRLGGNWMFDNERAMRRLQMCEDCRINDMWDEQGS
jgi:ferredoxin